MSVIEIDGDVPLAGRVTIAGSKNGALPLMAAAILADGPLTLSNVPDVRDVRTLAELLRQLGVRVEVKQPGVYECEVEDETRKEATYDLVSEMRASVCVLGPLVARRGGALVARPGGCSIGPRPIDIHLKGLRALGAGVEEKEGNVIVRPSRLKGCEMDLAGPHGPTVTGTGNVMCAATLAEGRTIIHNAAMEPEIQDLAHLLNDMGARISGMGASTLVIDGVPALHGAEREVIPDRIEAATFMIAAAVTRGDLLLERVTWEHLSATIEALRRIGVTVERELFGCRVKVAGGREGRLVATDVDTAPYPGLATDVQAPFSALLCLAAGQSRVTDTIFPDRFIHVDELNRLGASIRMLDAGRAIIEGVDHLSGAPVKAPDLRACAALILAGLAGRGVTRISNPEHIDRGYDRIEEKLSALGARIRRVNG